MLAAVMVTPTYGWDGISAFVEKNQIENCDQYIQDNRGFYVRGFDDFEGKEVWDLFMISEETQIDEICTVIVTSDGLMPSQFCCSVAITFNASQTEMSDLVRFKTDSMNSPKTFENTLGKQPDMVHKYFTYEDFQEMFRGNKLEVRAGIGGKTHTFNLKNDFVVDAVRLSY